VLFFGDLADAQVFAGSAEAFDHIKLIQQALKRVLAKQIVFLHGFFDAG